MTSVGPVEVRVPRDVAGSFDPQQVCKRQRRLPGVDASRHEAADAPALGSRLRPGATPPSRSMVITVWRRDIFGRCVALLGRIDPKRILLQDAVPVVPAVE
ncbi:hypothetical protein ACFYTU_01110 [Nonomuraea angiospora]|uniref:hypothetical protein n=1 Tax=Nonomuraea angiospora TaxID=46172 RepID=UPI00367FF7A6